MIIIHNKFIPFKGFRAITIGSIIFVRNDCRIDAVLINHEKIHIEQVKELLFIGFYVLYLLEYVIRLIKYKDRKLAYKNISFEREAYVNQENFKYIKYRTKYSWLDWL